MKVCPRCHREFPDDALRCPTDQGELEARPDTLIGEDLGGYVVQERIGSGGMSVVYRAVRTSDRKSVAIKLLNRELAANLTQLQRVVDEARILSDIHHPGTLEFYDWGTTSDGLPYIAMELLSGDPLDMVMWRAGAMSPIEVIPLLDQLLAAVGAAHEKGIVHRDLKPGNVFVLKGPTGGKIVKVLDYGLAKRVAMPAGAAQPGFRASGTPEYMAPEQACGEKAGAAADLYSIGVIAYEMLTGRLPFIAPNSRELERAHRSLPPPSLERTMPSVPAPLSRLIDELMRKDPRTRPPTADAVRLRLRRVAREMGLSPQKVPLPALPQRPERWRRVAAAACAAMALAFALLALLP
ncbi:MAG TPA: serine/threonine-protein kinase [Myxococcales bacterium]|jgi:serine/threonine-protein kinase